MGKFIRNLIEYTGVEDCAGSKCGFYYDNNFKQTNVDVEFCVPCQKPDMEQIVRVNLDKKIIKYKIVNTPIGTSLEGQNITGSKLLVMGELNIKVVYVADEPEQSMHAFHVDIPFCEYIVLPEGFSSKSIVKPEICIEDIYVKQRDARCAFGNITLMIVGDTY